jgi:hypothetical protein
MPDEENKPAKGKPEPEMLSAASVMVLAELPTRLKTRTMPIISRTTPTTRPLIVLVFILLAPSHIIKRLKVKLYKTFYFLFYPLR